MTASKPVFVIISGAWFPPESYGSLKEKLESLGYECIVPKLPSLNGERGTKFDADVAMIRELVIPLFDSGKESGGFRAIIFMASGAVPEEAKGLDMLTGFGGKYPGFMTGEEPYKGNSMITANEKAKSVFFNDMSEEEGQKWFDRLLPHSQDALESPVPYAATDIKIPKYWLICERDLGLPPAVLEQMLSVIPGAKSKRIDAGHCPFLSQPGRTAELIIEMTEEASSELSNE
ncbi:Alpha/beta hydrolase fold-1 [Xylariomycetidae sp. FL2044]|nr:Alpha/beta hydrolase fold-1 [Xylariomycetidae sp. FL2044]